MLASQLPVQGVVPLLRSSNALERLNALRQMPAAGDMTWVWIMIGGVAMIVISAAIAIGISRRLTRIKEAWAIFDTDARRVGLSKRERDLLAVIAKMINLQSPGAIFTVDSAFNQGVSYYIRSGRLAPMSEQRRSETMLLLQSLREKLGFHKSSDSDMSSQISSRDIVEGTRISIARHGKPGDVGATIVSTSSMEMVVEPDAPIEFKPGEAWLVRFSDAGAVWEFDTPVIKQSGKKVVLAHADHIRFINRRRFPRTPIERAALVADFPFHRPDGGQDEPEFLPAKLVEIAGPGLKLQAAIEVGIGCRVLVIVKFDEGTTIEALAKVRRVVPLDDGVFDIAVELLGLSSAEISELARQTNTAAVHEKTARVPAEAQAVASSS